LNRRDTENAEAHRGKTNFLWFFSALSVPLW